MENEHLFCEKCDFVTTESESTLVEHMKSEHFECDSCDFIGARKSYLDVHIQKQHVNKANICITHYNGEPKFICEMCGYKTTYRKGLQVSILEFCSIPKE